VLLSQNTYDEGKTQWGIGSSFAGAYKNYIMNKIKTKASDQNTHNKQFPTYGGTDHTDVDDESTGELEGVFECKPVLLSRFEQLPTRGIIEDMIKKMEVNQPFFTLPALTLPEADTMLPGVAEADIEDSFK